MKLIIQGYLVHFITLLCALVTAQAHSEGMPGTHNITANSVPRPVGPPKGTLILHGGGTFQPGLCDLFVAQSGGKDKRFVIIPTGMPDEKMEDPQFTENLEKCLRDAGATHITILHTRNPNEANMDKFVEPLREASGVLFWGGRQWRIMDAYANTRVEMELVRLLERDGVIMGSSAGASVMGTFMPRGDTKSRTIFEGDHQTGFGFVDAAFDQHTLDRNRQFDGFAVLKKRPGLLLFGIEEDTAIIMKEDKFQVMGKSKVLVYDGKMYMNDLEPGATASYRKLEPGEEKFYCISDGTCYDLQKREVISEGKPKK